MNVVVSNSSDVPLYVQIKEQIKDAILKGELEGGQRHLRFYGQSGTAQRFKTPHH